MHIWQDRVIDERAQLSQKIIALQSMIGNAIFEALAEADKQLLRLQLEAMLEYLAILDARIERLS